MTPQLTNRLIFLLTITVLCVTMVGCATTWQQIRENAAEADKRLRLDVAECDKRQANKEINTEIEGQRCYNEAGLRNFEFARQGINTEEVSEDRKLLKVFLVETEEIAKKFDAGELSEQERDAAYKERQKQYQTERLKSFKKIRLRLIKEYAVKKEGHEYGEEVYNAWSATLTDNERETMWELDMQNGMIKGTVWFRTWHKEMNKVIAQHGSAAISEYGRDTKGAKGQFTPQAFRQWWASLPRDTRLTLTTLHQNEMMARQMKQAAQMQTWRDLADALQSRAQRQDATRRKHEIWQLKNQINELKLDNYMRR